MKVPGLVDLQVNGYRGVDFSGPDLMEESFARAARQLLDAGTAAFLPTLITSSTETYEHCLPVIARVIEQDEFRGHVLGIHLEGPFISPEDGARGAHTAQWVREPDVDYLNQLIEWSGGHIRILTLAADQKGAAEVARYATERGITVSLGHQMADEEDLARLAAAGAQALTHLGNGVPSLLPRHKNPIWAGLGNDDLTAIIIADGHHLPPAMLKTFIRTKGSERCILVSDASPLAGLSPGEYESMGAHVVLEANGLLHNPATGYLAGSSATILTCVNHLASLDLVAPEELLRMAWDNPLRLIGVAPEQVQSGPEIQFDEKRRQFYLK